MLNRVFFELVGLCLIVGFLVGAVVVWLIG